jgi:hypothetical protein
VAIKFSFRTAPPHRWVLEKPKNEVRRTDTCQGYLPNGAFFPPTILVSGRGTVVERPHWMFLAADKVSLPGLSCNGLEFSVRISFSRTSVEMISGLVGMVGWRGTLETVVEVFTGVVCVQRSRRERERGKEKKL